MRGYPAIVRRGERSIISDSSAGHNPNTLKLQGLLDSQGPSGQRRIGSGCTSTPGLRRRTSEKW